ncbi:MAG: hypothetical protein AABW50_02170 [Nanoarchaeota archaeon]
MKKLTKIVLVGMSTLSAWQLAILPFDQKEGIKTKDRIKYIYTKDYESWGSVKNSVICNEYAMPNHLRVLK